MGGAGAAAAPGDGHTGVTGGTTGSAAQSSSPPRYIHTYTHTSILGAHRPPGNPARSRPPQRDLPPPPPGLSSPPYRDAQTGPPPLPAPRRPPSRTHGGGVGGPHSPAPVPVPAPLRSQGSARAAARLKPTRCSDWLLRSHVTPAARLLAACGARVGGWGGAACTLPRRCSAAGIWRIGDAQLWKGSGMGTSAALPGPPGCPQRLSRGNQPRTLPGVSHIRSGARGSPVYCSRGERYSAGGTGPGGSDPLPGRGVSGGCP